MLRLPIENTLDREEKIMAEWEKVKVGDIGKVITGKTPKTYNSEYYGGNIPFLTPSDDMSVKYVRRTNKYITELGRLSVKNATLPANAICVSCIGSDLGKVVITTQETVTNQQINSIVVDTDKFDIDFVYYSMLELGKVLNFHSKTSTAVPIVNKSSFSQYEIDCPKLNTQKRIGAILSSIDKKIEENNQINNNLEQQAQAIFKFWFIDFEPFSSRKPSNWSVSTLGNVAIMGVGGDKPQNVSPIKTDLYEYPIYSNGLSNEGLYGFTDKPKISEESVTVSARGTIGFVCLRHIPYVPIVRLVTLIPKAEIISAKYLYLWLKQLHITGTGTTQQQLTVPDFQKTEILVPSQEIVTLFTATVEPIFEKIWANQNENEKLSSLRDTLLPKLMSGELDVSNIEI